MAQRQITPDTRDSGLTIVEILISMFIVVLIAFALLPLFVQSTQQSARTGELNTATQLVAARIEAARAVGSNCSALALLQGTQKVQGSQKGVGAAQSLTVTTTEEACPGASNTVLVTVTVTADSGGATLATASTRIFVSDVPTCTFSHAATPPASVNLGGAFNYSVLSSAAVTNGGASVFPGQVGSTGGAITGMAGATAGCYVDSGDPNDAAAAAAATDAAVSDLATAYQAAANKPSTGSAAGDLAGATIYPGVYRAGAAMAMTTNLVFDAQGDPNAIFLFQIPAALNTAAASTMTLINGAQSANVFWQVAGAVTLGASSHFIGTILGNAAITVGAGTSVDGRALTGGGAVTLDNNVFGTPGAVS